MDSLSGAKLQERQRLFMSGCDIETLATRREKFAVELRKQKRTEQTLKRRNLAAGNSQSLPDLTNLLQERFPELVNSGYSDLERLQKLGDVMNSSQSQEEVLTAVSAIRIVAAQAQNPPIELILQANLAQPLLRLLQCQSIPLVREASWAVCNILSGPHTCAEEIVKLGGVMVILRLLDVKDLVVKEHALWCLGNLAGDCNDYLQMLVKEHIVEKVIDISRSVSISESIEIHRIILWLLFILARSKVLTDDQTVSILPDLQGYSQVGDLTISKDLLWLVSSVSDNDDLLEQVSTCGLDEYAVSLLHKGEDEFIMPAMRILGNMVTGDNQLTQRALNLGLLDVLQPLIQHREHTIRKEAQWILSNVAAGTSEQRDQFLNHAVAREALIGFNDPSEAVRLETSWVFHNIASAGSLGHRFSLLNFGIIPLLKDRFQDSSQVVKNVLLIIYRLIEAGSRILSDGANSVIRQLVASGCAHELEKLTHTDVGYNSEFALNLLDTYFSFAED